MLRECRFAPATLGDTHPIAGSSRCPHLRKAHRKAAHKPLRVVRGGIEKTGSVVTLLNGYPSRQIHEELTNLLMRLGQIGALKLFHQPTMRFFHRGFHTRHGRLFRLMKQRDRNRHQVSSESRLRPWIIIRNSASLKEKTLIALAA